MKKTLPEKWHEGTLTQEDVKEWLKRNGEMLPADIEDENHLSFCLFKIYRHFEEDELVGDFLQAIVENDLLKAGLRADNVNAKALSVYAYFLHSVAPSPIYDKVRIGGD